MINNQKIKKKRKN